MAILCIIGRPARRLTGTGGRQWIDVDTSIWSLFNPLEFQDASELRSVVCCRFRRPPSPIRYLHWIQISILYLCRAKLNSLPIGKASVVKRRESSWQSRGWTYKTESPGIPASVQAKIENKMKLYSEGKSFFVLSIFPEWEHQACFIFKIRLSHRALVTWKKQLWS